LTQGTDRERSGTLPASRDLALAAAKAAADKQASDIAILDVSGILVITDFFVICSAATHRQLRTVIDAIESAAKELGVKPLRREGEADAGWWLLDFFDVVVHVFGEEEREYYDLERLWSDAPRLTVPGADEAPAAG
jgi:ribosome-associated protein